MMRVWLLLFLWGLAGLCFWLAVGIAMAQEQQSTEQQAALNAYRQLGLSLQIYMDRDTAAAVDLQSRLKWVLDNWVPKPEEKKPAQ